MGEADRLKGLTIVEVLIIWQVTEKTVVGFTIQIIAMPLTSITIIGIAIVLISSVLNKTEVIWVAMVMAKTKWKSANKRFPSAGSMKSQLSLAKLNVLI